MTRNLLPRLLAVALLLPGAASATMPPSTDAQKRKAEEAKAKAAWSDKVAAYQLCRAQDRVATHFQADMQAQGKPANIQAGAPCNDPGPFTVTAATPAATEAGKTGGGAQTAPVATPSDHKPAAAAGKVQSTRTTP